MTALALDVVDLLTANNRLLERLCDAVGLANVDRDALLADLENVQRSRHQADETVMYPQWLALGLADAVEAHRVRRAELLDILAGLRSQTGEREASDPSLVERLFDEMLHDLGDLLTRTIEDEEALLVLPLALHMAVEDRVLLGGAFRQARTDGSAVAMAGSVGLL